MKKNNLQDIFNTIDTNSNYKVNCKVIAIRTNTDSNVG